VIIKKESLSILKIARLIKGGKMILKFEFFYSSDNDFFEYLLHFYAQNFFYHLEKKEEKIDFYLKGEENEMLEFCELLNNLPSSVFLRNFNVSAENNLDFEKSIFKPSNYVKKDFLTRLNANFYLEKNDFALNEWNEFVNDELSFDDKTYLKISPENAPNLMQEALLKLEKNESIYIKNHLGNYELFLFDAELRADFLMPCDIKAISSAFVCNDEQLKLLASLEKPLLSLRMSAVFRQNHGLKTKEFKLKLANNIFLFALTNALFNKNHKFLSFKKIRHFEDDFELFELEKKLVILRGFDFINQKAKKLIFSKKELKNSNLKEENLNEKNNENLQYLKKEARNFARLSYIVSKSKKDALFLELSKDYEDILLLNKELNLLKLFLPSSATKLYEDIKADEVGARLLNNFSLNFKLLEGEFKLKNNFYSLLGLVGKILNLDSDLENAAKKLLAISDESKMPRGVKIDYRFKESDDNALKEFDYTRTIRSTMSFLLAGVDVNNIAYGAVESLAFFLRDFYDDLVQKKQAQSAIITGSLFSHKFLLKNTLKHIKHCELTDVPLYI